MDKDDFSELERLAVVIHIPLLTFNSKFIGFFESF